MLLKTCSNKCKSFLFGDVHMDLVGNPMKLQLIKTVKGNTPTKSNSDDISR